MTFLGKSIYLFGKKYILFSQKVYTFQSKRQYFSVKTIVLFSQNDSTFYLKRQYFLLKTIVLFRKQLGSFCQKACMIFINCCISVAYENVALNRPKREYLTVNMPLVNSTVRMIVGINNILLQNTSLRFMRTFLMNRRRSLGPMIALSLLFR